MSIQLRTSVALVLALTVAGCGSGGNAAPAVAPAGSSATAPTASAVAVPPTITDIKNISQLQAAFNQHTGKPRLIVLMSPT